ncbi:MAG TPA: DNA polymerase [Patescibacteria group bacterium]|nr:DNA polymerase [Patescibacteria group bacterium]
MQPPKDYANLFLDMNAFFASVEQQVQPSLRNKPICVAPYPGNTGCCIAKSYKAKAFGVKTGTLVGEAKKLCPQIIVLESRPELYLFYHREIVKVLKNFSPFLRVLSIDEFNIKLTGLDQNREKALEMARKIKETILKKVGDYLTCSIGIGPNMWLAKVAGELGKACLPAGRPDGLVVVALEELGVWYRSLDLMDLPGINVAMARQLHHRKIKTPFDFYLQPLFNLSRWFGHPGRVWFYRLRGFETDEIEPATKSIGHQHVLAPEYRTIAAARRVLVKLAEKCAQRLRAKNLWTGGVSLGIKFLNGPFWEKNAATDLVADSQNIQRIALSLYDACPIQKPPLRIAVTLFNLTQVRGEQISLFSKIEKSRRLSQMMDEINDKYGPETIYPASMFGASEAAPTRIPFGNPARIGNFDQNVV